MNTCRDGTCSREGAHLRQRYCSEATVNVCASSCNHLLPWQRPTREQQVSSAWIFAMCRFCSIFKKHVPANTRVETSNRQTNSCFIPCSRFPFAASAASRASSHSAGRRRSVHVECADQSSWISILLTSRVVCVKCLFCSVCTSLCPPHSSIPVWLDLKGQLEGWQPSLSSEGRGSKRRSEMERDESRNCRWGRAGREQV